MTNYRDDKIRGRQAELNWTVDVLAATAGVTAPTVIAARKGRPVSRASLEKISAALNLTMSEIYAPKPETETAHA